MNNIEKIKAEIERRIEAGTKAYSVAPSSAIGGVLQAYENILAFINSLPEEPVSEDLEEAAWMYYDKNKPALPPEFALHRVFVAFFEAGAQWQKKQMMKDVVLETTVVIEKDGSAEDFNEVEYAYYEDSEILKVPKWAKNGDKVKVIIIKED